MKHEELEVPEWVRVLNRMVEEGRIRTEKMCSEINNNQEKV